MAHRLNRPVVVGALLLLLFTGWSAWTLFFTSGDLRYVLVRSWGSDGTAPGEFSAPIGVAIGPAGDVYVTDSGNNRIQRFRPDGTLVGIVKLMKIRVIEPQDIPVNSRREPTYWA